MGIHTAGEQKYYGFIEERVKQLRTGMIVWGSLLGCPCHTECEVAAGIEGKIRCCGG